MLPDTSEAVREELKNMATVANFATLQKEGSRYVERKVEYYNLDMILSVGYRVKSERGILYKPLIIKALDATHQNPLLIIHNNLPVTDVDQDGGVAVDVTVEDGLCEDIDQLLLHESFDRTGSVCWLVSLGGHIFFEAFGEFDGDSVFREFLLKVSHLHPEDVTDVGL